MTTESFFVEGAIAVEQIAQAISALQAISTIGAHDIFMGQVRADEIESSRVHAIEYSAYKEMAEEQLEQIVQEAKRRFNIQAVQIWHSLGTVKVGEICLFVAVSAKRRVEVFEGLPFVVNAIKDRAPIFGKELLSNETHQWKVNS